VRALPGDQGSEHLPWRGPGDVGNDPLARDRSTGVSVGPLEW